MSVTGNLKINTLTLTGSATVGSNTVLNAPISVECKTALSNLVVASAWKQSYGSNIVSVHGGVTSNTVSALKLPYGNNIFTPVAAVHLYKNGDSVQYQSGILKADPVDSNLRVDENTLYNGESLTKTVTALLYARFKTLNIIPPGNSTTMEYYFPNMSNITFFVPSYSTALSAYIVTPTTRKLYLDDIFSESVGFHCGYDAATPLNPIYGSSNLREATKSSVLAYDATKNLFYGANSNILAAPYEYSFVNGYVDNGSNIDPDVNFDAWLNKYKTTGSGSNLQLYDHGKLNYNSSENFGTAVLTRAYHNYYPASNTMKYYDILKKELLTPLGSGLIDSFTGAGDANFLKLATTWSGSNVNFGIVPNVTDGYSPDHTWDLSISGHSQFYSAYTQFSSNHRNSYGNSGLIGTLSDFSKVLQVIARNGLMPDGRRLINASEIANMMIPRVTADEYAQTTITETYGTLINTFSLGGTSRGPPYKKASTIAPNENYKNFKNQGTLTVEAAGSDTLYLAPINEFGWYSATGLYSMVCPKTETVAIMATTAPNTLMTYSKFVAPCMDIIRNEYYNKSVDIVP